MPLQPLTSPAVESAPPSAAQTVGVWVSGLLGVVAIGGIDYVSGSELRVFPLYYAPISLVAWHRGRTGAVIVSALCAMSWLGSNLLAGLQFSHQSLWVANSFMQATSFAIVGLLIASLRAALRRERELNRIDPLTSLRNTRAFHEDGVRMLALCRRKKRPVTVAYIDLDNFKIVNDTLGHQGGDDLLRSVGSQFRASLRTSDVCARLGGDEFVVLLPEVGPEEAGAALERLQALVAQAVASSPCPVTSSIGGVTFLTVPERVEDVVHQADVRMYAAKTGGKNQVTREVVS